MLTNRENYLLAAHGEKPEWVPLYTEEADCFQVPVINPDPDTMIDCFGIKWENDSSGMMPSTTELCMDDIRDWRTHVTFPDLSKLDWQKFADEYNATNKQTNNVRICRSNTQGPFLIPINMMGWVDGLCAFAEEPEASEEFISALTDYFVEIIKYYGKYMKPDIVFSGDDLAASTGPFISMDMWRTMFKPYFKKLADAIHEIGALAEFHCCGRNDYLAEEIIDAGYDIEQLPVPNDDLLAVKKKLGSKLVMTGGWDRQGDASMIGASEDCVRASARKAIDDYGSEGGLIFWDGGIIGQSDEAKQKMAWLHDEVRTYSRELYR